MRFFPAVMVAAACGGGGEPIAISFAKPGAGENFVRDTLNATGALAAMVPIELAIDGDPTQITLQVGARSLLDLDQLGTAVAEIREAGVITLTANAFDGETVVSTATVDVTIGDLALATCKEWLDVYRIEYTSGPAQPGVADPVTARMPINGVGYKVSGAMNPRTMMYGDCRLIRSLAQAASFLRERDVTQVTDIGVYNYRCIGGGTPPNCPNGISQHAYAMAIDLAGFTTGDGTFYSVNDDWIIDPDNEKTCSAPTVEGKDRWLHELICELKAADVWNIVLTPNYNAAHRDHFHVDLTPMRDFIERRNSPVPHH